MKRAIVIGVGVGFVGALALVGACGPAPIDAVGLAPPSLARGLVAHWTLDEMTGTAVTDHSGNGHHGVLTGGRWASQGRFGSALAMVPGDSVAVPDFPQATSNWTVSLWTYLTAADMTSQGETLLSTESVFAGGWQMHLDDRAGYKRFDAAYWVGDPINDYVVLFCDCIETEIWIHLTAVFNGTDARFALYRDAVPVDQTEMPHMIVPGDSTLYFGKWNMNERLFSGALDDVAIWNRALTADEIALITRQSPPDSP